jgi:hypothetical protein
MKEETDKQPIEKLKFDIRQDMFVKKVLQGNLSIIKKMK